MGSKKPKIIGDRKWIRYLTVAVSLLGMAISVYGYYVEVRMEQDPKYKPLCDFSHEVRCSKALSSKYGMGFGFLGTVFGEKHALNIRNTLYGAGFYVLMAGLGYARNSKASVVQLNLAFISVLVSGYLAYHLFFNLKELCPVCIATYAVNVTILILSIFKGKPRIAGPNEGARASRATNGRISSETDGPKTPTQSVKSDVTKGSYAQVLKKKRQD